MNWNEMVLCELHVFTPAFFLYDLLAIDFFSEILTL